MTNVILVNNHAQTTFVRLAQIQDSFSQRPFLKDLFSKTFSDTSKRPSTIQCSPTSFQFPTTRPMRPIIRILHTKKP